MKSTKTFNVAFPVELLDEVDAVAKKRFGSRSDLLREAALKMIRDEKRLERLFNETEKIGAQSQFGSAEEATTELTKQRRARRALTK
ncbi:hypothetical protein KC952_00595 [Candidatus Saccharibacteria bacterium]|nr:hypothetical protein [Candidatus Saccharibacteria bacterium]